MDLQFAQRSEATELPGLTGRSFWLDTSPEAIYGVLHVPDPGLQTAVAALILPPFGWDNDCSYRPRRVWATEFAKAGVTTARIDFPGTEDSVGGPVAPNRLGAWVDATTTAASWLRRQSGCDRLLVVGIGLGGIVAQLAIAGGAPIDDLVLWGVRASGRAFMREMRAYANVVAAQIGDEDDGEREDGVIGIGGHALTSETADAIGAVSLADVPLPHAELRRVLLVGRDAHGVDQKLKDHFSATGADVTVIEADDYQWLMSPPDFNVMPDATIAASIEWLQAASLAAMGALPHPPAAAPPATVDSIEFEYDGAKIQESLVELETGHGRLVGVLSRPSGDETAAYCLISVNSGALRHTGPNRMLVEIDRRAAAAGIPAARFDLPGYGDSDGDPVNTFERNVDDLEVAQQTIREFCDHLRSVGVADRFVTVGQCVGGYLGMHAVIEDDRTIGTICLDAPAFKWNASHNKELIRGLMSTGQPESSTAMPQLTRVPARLAPILERMVMLRHRLENKARQKLANVDVLWRLARRARFADVAQTLEQLGRTGAWVLLLYAENEDIRRTLAQGKPAAVLRRTPEIHVEWLPTRDHLLRSLRIQELTFGHVSRALDAIRSSVDQRRAATESERPGDTKGGPDVD